jgi:hypothetical protein
MLTLRISLVGWNHKPRETTGPWVVIRTVAEVMIRAMTCEYVLTQ